MTSKKQKVVFLDRDGTMIFEPPGARLILEKDEKLFPDTITALSLLAKHDIPIVIVTNQAGIYEGIIDLEQFTKLNDGILEMIKPSGVKCLKTYVCPHASDGDCECRKPKPKMLLDAAKEFNIDLSQSYIIGDRMTDIEAGDRAGTKTILVETGVFPIKIGIADYDATSFIDAVQHILET